MISVSMGSGFLPAIIGERAPASAVRRADKIVGLEGGCITEVGTRGGVHQRLHELQRLDPAPLVNP